ncbi:PIR Superfamily Protein [Plasmodium malariae]|uniref:PIR Superfamily Protein n=1 Tax=Plasmodium malariae TaxID=5858 RepID=A0A1A8WY18_PLAMA|nr:PIR Superfamily Protein [Plasmodium malariae]
MDKINYEEILQQLPSNKIYEEFNSEVTEIDNSFSCDKFDSIKQEYKLRCVNLCKKVARNLKKVPKVDKLWSYNHRCLHYKYWVYEEINKLLEENSAEGSVKDVITEFLNLQSSLTDDYRILNCTYNFDKKTLKELNDKKDEKYLYDYFTNYENIKSKDFCISVEKDKYKNYLNAIKVLYNQKKNECCGNNILKCPNYFLNCNNDFDPIKLLSKIESTGVKNCNGLENFKETKTSEEKLESSDLEPGFLDQILFTNCHITNESTQLPCRFIRASAMTRRNQSAVGSSEQGNSDSLTLENKKLESNIKLEASVQHEEIRKRVGFKNQEKKNILSLPKNGTEVDFRWKLAKDGTLQCPTEKPEDDTSGLCKYIEQLVGKGILVKIKNTGSYRLAKGKSWPTEPLKIVVKRERKSQLGSHHSRELEILRGQVILRTKQMEDSGIKNLNGKAYPGKDEESNILQNIFLRFTPFGTYLGKTRKRKKIYRTNFSELSTQRLPRRFIKRTYRNSERRRFSVVNIEPRTSFH